MSTHPQAAPRALPDRPNIRHLKDQAKDLFKAGAAVSITDAQFKIARLYGFPSWPKLKAQVDVMEQLHAAYQDGDVARLSTLLDRQVNDLMASGGAASRADAQTAVARFCGLTSWAEVEAGLSILKKRVDAFEGPEVRHLGRAIEADDITRVKTLMTSHPTLHRAPMG